MKNTRGVRRNLWSRPLACSATAELFASVCSGRRGARRLFLWLAVGLLSCACGCADAAAGALWRIGQFDASSSEFNSRRLETSTAPVYVIGKSDPARDWHAFQPASSAEKPAYPFAIQFELPESPRGRYVLVIALLVNAPGLPVLQVEINGSRGWFYQHPTLSYTTGDIRAAFYPMFSESKIVADLPATYLKRGTNTLVLTAIDESGKNTYSPTERRTAGINYDALELQHDPDAGASEAVAAEVVPTVFYKQDGGKLVEEVDAFIRFRERPRQAGAALAVGNYKANRGLAVERDFGEQRVEWEVPEFGGTTKGELAVTFDGQSRRFPLELKPARKWTVFVAPHTHLDVGFTDYQGKVAERHSRTIDEALAAIGAHPDFRFNIDGFWSVEQFFKGRSKDQQDRFLQAVRENKISVPAQYAHLVTGLPTLEGLIRSLYPSHRFHSDNGIRFDYANSTDVPSFSWSYASVLAAAGLHYFVSASNNHNAPILLYGRLHEKSPFWWEGPDGARILMWYSRIYQQAQSVFGAGFQVPVGRESLPLFLQIYSHPEYRADGVLLYGTEADNTALHPAQFQLAADWNKIYAYPKLRYASFPETMRYIAKQSGDSIPVVKGDGGPYWEDGAIADAWHVALARENEHRALAAEKFSTLSALLNPIIRPDRKALDELWRNVALYDEHTWEDSVSESDPESQRTVGQRAVKFSRATESKLLLDHVLQRGMAAIADLVDAVPGDLLVFNPLNWQRAELVEMDVRRGYGPFDPATGKAVPYEMLSTGASLQHIRFLASGVPAVGYKRYATKPQKAAAALPEPRQKPAEIMENAHYRIVLDTESGAIRNIFDKELKREVVDQSSLYRFGQYLYVSGADETPNRLIKFPNNAPLPKLEVHGAGSGSLISLSHTPFGTVARLRSSTVNTPQIETEIILFDGEKKIEFINRVRKTPVYRMEGVYFAFPLAMERPEFKYEIQNGFVDPRRDQMPGAGKEWFSVQGWIAVEQDKFTAAIVPLDAPLAAFGDIVRGTFPKEFGERRGTVFSYVMNNYWEDNFVPAQGGDFTFRYVLSSGAELQPEALSRLAWSAMSPLETNDIRAQDQGGARSTPLESAQASFLQIENSHIVLVNWKMAEDGHGTILRLLETAGKAGDVTISSPLLAIDSAWLCNAMEENQRVLPVSGGLRFAVKPFQIVTLRVETSGVRKPAL